MLGIRRLAPQLLQRLQHGVSKFELVYASNPEWPFPQFRKNNHRPLRISILDSSFNPPTLAHLGLANSHRPRDFNENEDGMPLDYDANLLLLSVANADKVLKPGDATYEERLEMMYLLATKVHSTTVQHSPVLPADKNEPFATETRSNVAIAIVNEPTFVGKSEVLLTFLKSKPLPAPGASEFELTFLVGLDTLERIFSPRYYPSEASMMKSIRKFLSPFPDGDNSRMVSAHRKTASRTTTPDESNYLKFMNEFIVSKRISLIDMGDELSSYSSTAVRNALRTPPDSSWHNLVLKDIVEYIREQKLYRLQDES